MDTSKNIVKHAEPHVVNSGHKLNWLRAAVLGANDGIVSTASIVVGVAGASNSSSFILTAGVAGLVAGALSMGVGEYISVSTQRDTEKALIEKERGELKANPKLEFEELVVLYQRKGLTESTARKVSEELSAKDAFAAHVDIELGIDPNDLTDPWHAAYASSAAFLCGAVIPIAMITLSPVLVRIPITFFGVFLALVVTGVLSAYAGVQIKLKRLYG